MLIEKRELIFDGFYRLQKLSLKSEKTGDRFIREQFTVPNSVGVLLINLEEQAVVLVKQFRVGPEKELTEIIAGKLEASDVNIQLAARREVLEETGYEVKSIEYIHRFHTCPGPVSEEMQLFVALCGEQVASGGGLASEHEEIELVSVPFEDFLGTSYCDAKTLIAQQWLQLNLNRFKKS
jgi:ADP-ribose pyrophosphatase